MTDITELGTGAIQDPVDSRDYQASAIMGAPVVDWNTPFILPEPPNENQNGSSSCVSQAWSYYHWQLHGKDYSRKDLYSRIALPSGGAIIREGGLALINQGQATRDELPDPSPEDEADMRSGAGTPAQEASDKELNSFVIDAKDIDSAAWAVKLYKGVVFGVYVDNNFKNNPANPSPPTGISTGHALYLFGYHLHDGAKCTIAKSSWGTYGGTTVHHIKENYYLAGETFNPWTLIPKEQQIMNDGFFKAKDGQTIVYFHKIGTPSELVGISKLVKVPIPTLPDGSPDFARLTLTPVNEI